VRHGLGDFFRGKVALAAQVQYIVFDGRIGFDLFHGVLLFQGRAHLQLPYKVTDESLPAWRKIPSGTGKAL
jgi:hypothetical protein